MVQSKSAIFISHRPSSCKFCDRIVVLDHGQIMECGTHSEWMKLQGIYPADAFDTDAALSELITAPNASEIISPENMKKAA